MVSILRLRSGVSLAQPTSRSMLEHVRNQTLERKILLHALHADSRMSWQGRRIEDSHNNSPWMRRVASPPSSTSRSGPLPSGHVSICSVHHQYSSRVSPFHANTAAVSRATAAAAWSCKKLELLKMHRSCT